MKFLAKGPWFWLVVFGVTYPRGPGQLPLLDITESTSTQWTASVWAGWGGVGMMTFFELEHMVDATQVCLSCHCTHGGCYASLFVLSLHTWWMLRKSVCLVIAHMVDAMQLCLS